MKSSRILTAAILTGSLLAIGPSSEAAGPCAEPTITGTSATETLRGTSGPDVIDGRGGDDTLIGLGGDDVLCGGPGQDVLRGGPGDDILSGGADAKIPEDTDYYLYYGDTLVGGPGDDRLDGGLDTRGDGPADLLVFKQAPGPMRIDIAAGTATGEGDDTIVVPVGTVTGSSHDDVILGSDADETLVGGPGSDLLRGRGGDDSLESADYYQEHPDHVSNRAYGGPGNDTVNGSDGDDLLYGGRGRDMIQAAGGVDQSFGGLGPDGINTEVQPGEPELMDGGAGLDYLADVSISNDAGRYQRHVRGRIDMAAGTFTARFEGGAVNVTVRSFEDVSTPHGDHWTVFGTDGPDQIIAGFSSDPIRIYARGGNDRVFGSDQDDVIHGGRGHDTGSGWQGHDAVVSVEKIIRS